MPELPEVETVRRCLAPHLVAKTLTSVNTAPLALRLPLDPQALAALVGLSLETIERRGKYLVFVFPGRYLVCHLGMSGRFFLDASHGSVPPHTHAVFTFGHGVRLLFVDPRRFGLLQVFSGQDWQRHPRLAALGPEPFAISDVAASLLAARASRSMAVRNVLLDQQVVAGIGNIYANEALFVAGIRPQRPMRAVAKVEVHALARALADVVTRAVEAGGTTLRDGSFRNALGEPGFFAVDLSVYGRQGAPCPRCGTPIRRLVLNARAAYYCPRCQR